MSRAVDTIEAYVPPAALKSQLAQRIGGLTVMPTVARKAIDVAADPESSASDLARVVEPDPTLSIQLLATANSARFALKSKVARVEDAVKVLGFRHCRNMIVGVCMSNLYRRLPLQQEWVRERLWQHGNQTSAVASLLNKTFGFGFQGEEFVAGLIHDIGRSLLSLAMPDAFVEADPLSFDETPALLDVEAAKLQTDHASLGAWFLQSNGLPPEFAAVARYHHEPELAESHRPLVALISTADQMANYLQRNGEASGYELQETHVIGLRQLGRTDVIDALEASAESLLDDADTLSREAMSR